MRKILVLGAGHSAPLLIHHLLEHAASLDASVVVADVDLGAAEARVGGHERGRALRLDMSDDDAVDRAFDDAAVVVHMLPPRFQAEVGRRAIAAGSHMVSASYRSADTAALHGEARARGVVLLTEMGLDPGIDLMSAQKILEEIRAAGGTVERFLSYGGGLPEASFDGNPLRYCITWNPRNVAMSGEHGAQFLRDGRIRLQPRHRVFEEHWPVDVPGLGRLDGYANRDSLAFRAVHGFPEASDGGPALRTLIRGTLRWPGYCDAWKLLVRLGVPTETLTVPGARDRVTWAELVTMFLPDDRRRSTGPGDGSLRDRVARHLAIGPDDTAEQAGLDALQWLGVFDHDRLVGGRGEQPAQALAALLEERLPLPAGVRDLVVLHHEIDAVYAADHRGSEATVARTERTLSTLVCHGEPGGCTAMARTVGLPAALGVRRLLEGSLERRGCLGPTDSDVYEPILAALEDEGLSFRESTESLPTVET